METGLGFGGEILFIFVKSEVKTHEKQKISLKNIFCSNTFLHTNLCFKSLENKMQERPT